MPTDPFGLTVPPPARISSGPRLTFTAGRDVTGTEQLIDVDRAAPTDPRDRAICRALLTHALRLLDETEQPTTTKEN
ncbi:hypothetical protein ACFW08_20150 [Streptomyces sp. NPDC058960]|uniref:hypothetical protein n=1 Tax=Streptomyces sp. NPDC058960 TaxID=3346679 RepID=UPI0036A8B658